MKANATLEDYQNREKFLIQYIESQILKAEKQMERYLNVESQGKRKAYKDILFKLKINDINR